MADVTATVFADVYRDPFLLHSHSTTPKGVIPDQLVEVLQELTAPAVNGSRWREAGAYFQPFTISGAIAKTSYDAAHTLAQRILGIRGLGYIRVPYSTKRYRVMISGSTAEPVAQRLITKEGDYAAQILVSFACKVVA